MAYLKCIISYINFFLYFELLHDVIKCIFIQNNTYWHINIIKDKYLHVSFTVNLHLFHTLNDRA